MDHRQAFCAPVALAEGLNSRGLVIPLTDSGVSPPNVAEWAKGIATRLWLINLLSREPSLLVTLCARLAVSPSLVSWLQM